MVIMHSGRESAGTNPTPAEIIEALRGVNAHPIAEGVWTAVLASGRTLVITDPERVDTFAAVTSISDRLDEEHGAARAELSARIGLIMERLGVAVAMWRCTEAETYSRHDVHAALAEVALFALVAIDSIDGEPAAELTGAAVRELARIGGAR